MQRGNAEVIGRVWGHVAIEWAASHGGRAAAPPWSAFETERARAIAHRQTDHLTGSDLRVREQLARICHATAGEVYEVWRSSGWPIAAPRGKLRR